MAAPLRISLGFHASPPVALRVSQEELDRLRGALESGGWHDLQAEEGRMKLNLGHVLWVREDADDTRVGFGLGA
jgi:hypothetical protein